MPKVKKGDTVRVLFTGKLQDGSVFDSSDDSGPLEFSIGDGQVAAGFEQAVLGMGPGESKHVEVPAKYAYGPYLDRFVQEVDRERLPDDSEPQAGQKLEIRRPDGQAMVVVVKSVIGSKVELDANHPLAGKDLSFDIELLEIL